MTSYTLLVLFVQVFADLPPDIHIISPESPSLYTDELDQTLLGSGGFASVYRARMQDAVDTVHLFL